MHAFIQLCMCAFVQNLYSTVCVVGWSYHGLLFTALCAFQFSCSLLFFGSVFSLICHILVRVNLYPPSSSITPAAKGTKPPLPNYLRWGIDRALLSGTNRKLLPFFFLSFCHSGYTFRYPPLFCYYFIIKTVETFCLFPFPASVSGSPPFLVPFSLPSVFFSHSICLHFTDTLSNLLVYCTYLASFYLSLNPFTTFLCYSNYFFSSCSQFDVTVKCSYAHRKKNFNTSVLTLSHPFWKCASSLN